MRRRSTDSAVKRGRLVVVGAGINGPGQTTLEAAASMVRAEKLFYLVTDRTTAFWIRGLNRTATSLEDLYEEGKPRQRTYEDMAARILAAVRANLEVCAVFYGHPGMLVVPSHLAIRRARREGYPARMLAGVSADANLIADIGLNPGNCGIQSFEATDFLMSRRRFDSTSSLLLWQVGVLGESGSRRGMTCRPARLAKLAATLRRHYPARHRVVLYQAPTFPAHPPRVSRLALDRLPHARISALTTLYVPPLPSRPPDGAIVRWFEET